jgi:hypothetical protein
MAKNYHIATFRRSKMVWGMSIITTLILIGVSVSTLCIPDVSSGWKSYLVMAIILPLPVICFALSPRYLCLFGNMLILKRWVGSVTIPIKEITSVEVADKWTVLRSTRTMGNGGYFGYYGHYYNRLYGKFRMFATDTTNLYLIRTSRQNFVISCSSKEFITHLQEAIKQ